MEKQIPGSCADPRRSLILPNYGDTFEYHQLVCAAVPYAVPAELSEEALIYSFSGLTSLEELGTIDCSKLQIMLEQMQDMLERSVEYLLDQDHWRSELAYCFWDTEQQRFFAVYDPNSTQVGSWREKVAGALIQKWLGEAENEEKILMLCRFAQREPFSKNETAAETARTETGDPDPQDYRDQLIRLEQPNEPDPENAWDFSLTREERFAQWDAIMADDDEEDENDPDEDMPRVFHGHEGEKKERFSLFSGKRRKKSTSV